MRRRDAAAGDGESTRRLAGAAAPDPDPDRAVGETAAGAGAEARGAAWAKAKRQAVTFAKFVGPGFMISVAYIDPGNYSTDIAAGASYRFQLLFVVFVSNLFAIVLQGLAVRLGTVTGLDLAAACRAHCPAWLNYGLYGLAEVAIIATDIAEVIGTAVAINLLVPAVPLVAGCLLSILDVMAILFFYRPDGAMTGLRFFEAFVSLLVVGVIVCFAIQLSLLRDAPAAAVFRGFLPSGALVQAQGLYQACGILGATVMPHSLYLGSGIVQPRLREYDGAHGLLAGGVVSAAAPRAPAEADDDDDDDSGKDVYIPSLAAIRHSLKYSITELTLSLFCFALFVNSAILIVAGASLYGVPDAVDADIFKIHDLLSRSISPGAGTVFALALLLSGVSAGIVCTIAGQMVSEGALRWRMRPWLRRLVTRSISITPSIVVAGSVGRPGLNAALNASQVVLSIVLPFVTFPLIYFTSRTRFMTVRPPPPPPSSPRAAAAAGDDEEEAHREDDAQGIDMSNPWWLIAAAALVWLVIAVMNVANLVLLGKGKA